MRKRPADHPQTACLLFVAAVQRTNIERLTFRVMFGTMAGGQNPGPGRPEKNWVQYLVDDPRVCRASEGLTERLPLVLGLEVVLWPTAAKKGGKKHRGAHTCDSTAKECTKKFPMLSQIS